MKPEPKPQTRIPLKRWLFEESKRVGVAPAAVYARLLRGKYPDVQIERITARTLFVLLPETKGAA